MDTRRLIRSPLLRRILVWMALGWLSCGTLAWAEPPLRIGSKRFTESYVLGEVLMQTAAPHGPAEHVPGLGNTAIVFAALKSGNIDLYPDYLGTIAAEILHLPPAQAANPDQIALLADVNRALAPLGLGAGVPLGFEDTYALAMREADAERSGLRTLADLAAHPALRLGLSHEFLGRADGWPALAARYRLPQRPIGLDHGVAYDALRAGQTDVIDIYSTDARIRREHLRVLEDSAHVFPRYDAVVLYRLDVPARHPAQWQAISALAGRIHRDEMVAMNAAVELEGQSFARVASQFLTGHGTPPARVDAPVQAFIARLTDDLWRLTRRHLALVAASTGAAVLIGVPLGLLAARRRIQQPVLAIVGVLQTIPSLALLAMLIPLVGSIGVVPALIALTLYALLPIVRNTIVGLEQVPDGLRDAALALGLTPAQRTRVVDLPLALPVILAGIKTAAVISVGTATIAAFIGAGGYGERIATGLALNDSATLLAGAIPAAVLALLVQGAFEAAEGWLRRRRQPPPPR
ncbi:ABC transporter permease subunit [Ralstonia solanacearum]|uniref:ABC transporter permease/substrate-binding protein n=1 Tax=Ralstonia solanacearum TaxID=305 RepID=UPI001FF8458B|nr:glycine betaine ABC transporter substrate-binding protein [Ralstonia solanacearum]MDB0525363.1 ABC transporter permease subunit [Ralstonia solanacearum]